MEFSLSASTNLSDIKYLGENLDKVCWEILNSNSAAGRLLTVDNLTRTICANTSDEAMELLDNNPKYIDLYLLVSNSNPRALAILEKHGYMSQITSPSSMLVLNNLAKNTNPEAIRLLTNNLEHFEWRNIWSNPAAGELIKACYTNTWKKYCRFQHPDIVKKIERNLSIAKKNWATEEILRNPNPDVLQIFDLF
jgi:hypothetical protein